MMGKSTTSHREKQFGHAETKNLTGTRADTKKPFPIKGENTSPDLGEFPSNEQGTKH
jgi:hypothetical protein